MFCFSSLFLLHRKKDWFESIDLEVQKETESISVYFHQGAEGTKIAAEEHHWVKG